MNSITIPVIKSSGYTDLDLPSYQTAGASGMDLLAAVEHEITIKPGEREMISTGISVQIPDGYEVQIRPRSGALGRSILDLKMEPKMFPKS